MKYIMFLCAIFMTGSNFAAEVNIDHYNYSNYFNLSRDELKGYLSDYMENIHEPSFSNNGGGMHAPDMFTLYLTLKVVQPTLIIESGVWKGLSTKLIRKTMGDSCTIICLEPEAFRGCYRDKNPLTLHYTGKNFIDFADLDISMYEDEKILVFFDDHINQVQRLAETSRKNIKHIIFNDNYAVRVGSHLSIEHMIYLDQRSVVSPILSPQDRCLVSDHAVLSRGIEENRNEILPLIKRYNLFPSLFSTTLNLGEGKFEVQGYFDSNRSLIQKYNIFYTKRATYRWNTYIELY